MKKILTTLCLILCIFTFGACSGNSTPENSCNCNCQNSTNGDNNMNNSDNKFPNSNIGGNKEDEKKEPIYADSLDGIWRQKLNGATLFDDGIIGARYYLVLQGNQAKLIYDYSYSAYGRKLDIIEGNFTPPSGRFSEYEFESMMSFNGQITKHFFKYFYDIVSFVPMENEPEEGETVYLERYYGELPFDLEKLK